MGTYNTSGSGKVYQLAEGRIGSTGQSGSESINRGRTVPWIWSAPELDANGTRYYTDVAMFPTYSVYPNGTLVKTYPQSAVKTFVALDQNYKRLPSSKMLNICSLRYIVVRILNILALLALLTATANGQAQGQPEKLAYGADRANVPDAISRVKSGEFGAIHVDLIARAGAVEAIPILKEQFDRVGDQLIKGKIAAALVRLGDKDQAYWNFLVEFAKPALESDVPDYIGYDSHGKAVPGPSPQFQTWAKAHNLPAESQPEDSARISSAGIVFLGWSEDPRAVPLLRKALLSPNHMLEIFAALGLAEIGDKDSIPFIIEACRKAPAEPATVIARALVYFDDNSAQSAVDEFIPKDLAKGYRDAKARGDTKPLSPPLYDKLPTQ